RHARVELHQSAVAAGGRTSRKSGAVLLGYQLPCERAAEIAGGNVLGGAGGVVERVEDGHTQPPRCCIIASASTTSIGSSMLTARSGGIRYARLVAPVMLPAARHSVRVK